MSQSSYRRPSAVRYARHGDVSIAYETFGDLTSAEPLLLIMGLDFQMVWWADEFCAQLVEAGFAVVRFDNRDTGLSTHFDSRTRQHPVRVLLGGTTPAYTGADMLDDIEAVLDAVGWPSAHVLGASMGAGLAQALALSRPSRVRSLVSAMGPPVTAGPLRTLTYLRPGALTRLALTGRTLARNGPVELLVEVYRALSSPGYPFPERWAREAATISHERSPRDPRSAQRQTATARTFRLPPLSEVRVPALVIVGGSDPLIRVSAGRYVARQIPGAVLRLYPGVGHTLPAELWPDIIHELRDLVARA
ncbi:alpha/beta fold hydrolase [Promicromonospora sp. NPDC050880]|uniref:alpha/beta fold hydrolase n=1 Tax=Promicromonospora sp. NPDC050880 TaxID=3364406 RepID=UPI0037BDCE72